MRGRKPDITRYTIIFFPFLIKKESPNEGTETRSSLSTIHLIRTRIKKESPNEGTETYICSGIFLIATSAIKKESPNEGTETPSFLSYSGQ